MRDAERIWREKSDEDLIDAAGELDQFTEEGQRIIREELKRRGLEDPVEQAAEEGGGSPGEGTVAALECLRCRTPLRELQAAGGESQRVQWPGPGLQFLDAGFLRVFACPSCGHVELFVDRLPEEEEKDEVEEAEG